MQLQTGDGISCDQCKMEYKDRFVYFSFDCMPFEFNRRKPTLHNVKSPNPTSLDICAGCFEQFRAQIVDNNKIPNINRCDLTNLPLVGNVYFVQISKATVNVSAKSVQVDDRFLEICITTNCFEKFVEQKNKRLSNEWTTNSS